jgi:hypothetical protein
MRHLPVPMLPVGLGASALVALATASGSPVLAQAGSYLLGPGSNVGPSTRVVPKNCVTAKDGTITCDTQIVNPPGDTPAKPIYEPFNN